MTTETLEQRGFVATAADIEELTHRAIDSANIAGDARATYLKALVASTQHKLGLQGKRRTQALTPAEVTQQLEAFNAIHKTFYEAVEHAVMLAPAQENERGMTKADILRVRANFARTAASAVRGFISTGHNVAGLNPVKVSKGQLREATAAVDKTARPMSPRSLGKKVSKLIEVIRARSKGPGEASKLLREAISQLRAELQTTRRAVPMTLAPTQPAANHPVAEMAREAQAA